MEMLTAEIPEARRHHVCKHGSEGGTIGERWRSKLLERSNCFRLILRV
eukprot:SAG31_NODE_27299_length_428_cov_0.933131_1_plen_47_part_10